MERRSMIDVLFETDPLTGYSLAEHILSEIQAHEQISAATLGSMVGDVSGSEVGPWLRRLHLEYGLVEKHPVSPASLVTVWTLSPVGYDVLRMHGELGRALRVAL